MADRISKTQRWLDLIAYLVGRRLPVTVDELMERIPAYAEQWRQGDEKARASVRRMFERDKDELRGLGIPLETVPYTIHYGAETVEAYRISRRDFYLPYLRLLTAAHPEARRPPMGSGDASGIAQVELREGEVGYAADALRHMAELPAFPLAEDARSARRKLAFDLGAERLGGAPVRYVDRPGADEVKAKTALLSDALLARKRVRFRYHGIARDEVTERDVAPYGLFFRGDWYLVGHDALRGDLRVFRVARMAEVAVNARRPKEPDYEVPAEFRLADYLDREAWELGDEAERPVLADVLFRFPWSLWAERNGHGEPVERRADGSAVRRFRVRQVNPFVRWLLALEGEAEVQEPAWLREELRAVAGEVAASHVAGGDSDG